MARRSDEVIFDAYTALTYKRQFGTRKNVGAGHGFRPPDWMGELHERRMLAYSILRSYQDNAAREYMQIGERSVIDDRREYGDAALLVNTIVGALLGEDQQIVTEGAEELALEEDGDGGTEDSTAKAEAERAMALQDWLRQWAKDERLGMKMLEEERLAIGLGDAVYTVAWSAEKGRPRLRVWDPMTYFPVLDDGNEDDYPRKVHIAWEVVDEDLTANNQTKIRRLTWELGPIAPVTEPGLAARLLRREADLFDGDLQGEDGRISRQYPWNEEPSFTTCYYTDATWTLESGKSVSDLTGGTAVYEQDSDGTINRRDLFLDFMPVIHVPNTVALIEHFGRSILSSVLQILDDISSADTDLSASAATTGHPVIALQGADVAKDANGRSKVTYQPGEILSSGDGKLDVLDTSKSLAALIGYIEFLLKRLSTNSRVAEALLGRIKPSEVPSGVALQLGFGPTDQLVKEMRLVRSEKYPLLLKFIHRIALAAQSEGLMKDVPEEWIHSEVVMGNFLPQDQAAAVDQVTALLATSPPAISTETAIIMLMEAGLPIQSVLEEVRRIQERDFKGAADLFDAIGEKGPVYDYLGLEEPEEPEVEPIVVDPSGQPIPPVPDPANPGADPKQFDSQGQPVA